MAEHFQAPYSEPAVFQFRRPEWHARANCRGMDPGIFFPSRGDLAGLLAAKEVCEGCEVKESCLEYALDHHEKAGVFGGTSDRERRRIRRRRSAA